jgi:hypothetical protein
VIRPPPSALPISAAVPRGSLNSPSEVAGPPCPGALPSSGHPCARDPVASHRPPFVRTDPTVLVLPLRPFESSCWSPPARQPHLLIPPGERLPSCCRADSVDASGPFGMPIRFLRFVRFFVHRGSHMMAGRPGAPSVRAPIMPASPSPRWSAWARCRWTSRAAPRPGGSGRIATMAASRRDRSTRRRSTPHRFGVPGQYDDNGVDVSLIRANMRVTPTGARVPG